MIFAILSVQEFNVLVDFGQIVLLDFASQPGDASRGDDQSVGRAVLLYLFVEKKINISVGFCAEKLHVIVCLNIPCTSFSSTCSRCNPFGRRADGRIAFPPRKPPISFFFRLRCQLVGEPDLKLTPLLLRSMQHQLELLTLRP